MGPIGQIVFAFFLMVLLAALLVDLVITVVRFA
jgi:hypothetical protein